MPGGDGTGPQGTDREPEEDRDKVAAAVVAEAAVVVEEAAVAVAEEVAAEAVVKGWARGWEWAGEWAGEWDADSGINFSRPERPHGRKSERK